MKKIYSILMAVVAVVAIAFSSNAATVSFNVDDTARVEVQIAYNPVKLTPGVDTSFEIEDYTSISIAVKDGNFLKSVTRRGSYEEQIYNMNSCYIYCSLASDFDGIIWDIVSIDADGARDAEVTVEVDEAANVSCQRSNTYSYVTLQDGENKVKFMSEDEVPLIFSHNTYGKKLYSVTLNGVAVEANGSYFEVSPQNGDKIVVTSNFPDVDVPVKFIYAEGAENFITRVTVDGTSVSNFNEENFTVKLGSTITIYGDTQNYKFDSLVINGESYTTSYFYSYEFTVAEENYEIEVNAHPYGTITAYITVDDVNNVTVYRGYSSNNDVITLESGVKTAVELSENDPLVSWVASSGCYIESVTLTTEGGSVDYTSYSSLSNIAEGAEISITTGIIERSKTAVVWIEDKSLVDYSGSFYGSYDRYLHSWDGLQTGYNIIDFADIDNPFYFGAYGSTFTSPAVYQNDEVVESRYGYNITFADKDVVKIYFSTTTPALYNVTFIAEGEMDDVECVKDHIVNVDAWKDGFSALQGTQVALSLPEGTLEVTVDGNVVAADENGKYKFIVDKDTEVTVVKDSSGVENVAVSETADRNVYNLQGICIVKDATDEQIKNLPAGLYIVNGEKIAVK